jgi:hypothetical protein
MSKYLKISIEEKETGNIAGAWIGNTLRINLKTGKALLTESGYKNITALRSGKREAVDDISWNEPNISEIITSSDITTGTKIEDIVYQAIVERMITLDNLPGTETPNPFKGALIEDV